MNDPEFRIAAAVHLVRDIYERIRREHMHKQEAESVFSKP
jgi:hypothetical protein